MVFFEVIVQGVGFLALIVLILMFQRNKRSEILLFKLVGTGLFFAHFLLLNAPTAALLNLVIIVRTIVYYHKESTQWARNRIWPTVFAIVILMFGLLMWEGVHSMLIMIGTTVATIAFWLDNPKYIRLLTLLVSPCWFFYHVISGSYAGMFTELFVSSSVVVGIIRFDLWRYLKVKYYTHTLNKPALADE